MDPLKIHEGEPEPWLPQYGHHSEEQQMGLRPSVLQPVHAMPPLPPSPVLVSEGINDLSAQHPHLVAQLSANLGNQNNQQQNSTTDGGPQFNTEQFQFSSPFTTSHFFASRPSVVHHTPNHFEPFQSSLFPFSNLYLPDFGLPGMAGMSGLQGMSPSIDNRFNPTDGVLKQGTNDGQPLFPKPLMQDELFSHLNNFSAAYNPVTLESILKEQKKAIKGDSPGTTRLSLYQDQSNTITVARINPECQVCQTTQANGLHFGARTCAACAAFFRRTISDEKKYVCKRSQRCNNPQKDSTGYRKICRACRLKRCMDIGMLPENVQHKRTRADSPSTRHDPMAKNRQMMGEAAQQPRLQDPPRLDPQTPILPQPDSVIVGLPDTGPLFDSVRPSLESMFPLYNQLNFSHLDHNLPM